MQKNVRFYHLLEMRLDAVVKEFLGKAITSTTIKEIRNAMLQTIDNIFSKSRFKLSKEAMTWLTDQYFKGIQLNAEYVMNDQVIINEYKLSELTLDDVVLLNKLFNETSMGEALNEEMNRRNVS
jgi:hypothetical protein